MKKIKAQYKAEYEPIGDLVTYRALPTEGVSVNQLDPFLILNHHGHQVYFPANAGLPFGPHPHRGFETVTFILEGELTHKDSSGAESTIKEGGVQWMTAGKGLIHAEISSNEFRSKGGPLEILQLWVNLPAKLKMTEPKYIGLQKADITSLSLDEGKVIVHLVSGHWDDKTGPVKPLVDITLASIDFKEGGLLKTSVPPDHTVFFYVVKGEVLVNGQEAFHHHLVEFEYGEEEIEIKAATDAVILFGHARPFKEPVVAYGPFVMNTREEIEQAYDDYRKGKFGPLDL